MGGGGMGTDLKGSGGMGGGMGSGMGMLAGMAGSMMPEAKRNSEFASSGISGNMNRMDRVNAGFEKGEKALASIPLPITQAIAGFSKLGRSIGKQTTDQYGLYKSKGSEMVDNVFNPAKGFAHSQSTVKDIFNGGGFDMKNAVNLGTAGLFGKSALQRQAEKEKKLFQMKQSNDTLLKNATLGATLTNSAPKYQAPAYGKNGMKFPTKFSR